MRTRPLPPAAKASWPGILAGGPAGIMGRGPRQFPETGVKEDQSQDGENEKGSIQE